ncbi:hypothetical protein BC831DRAFT_468208 [Entophlyctis helioformis]|nr:hypothetical protein BC831DRAFT_468208 [Entophlyctis helioformis]
MPVPFSNNKRMQYDGERALESLMSRYQASGSLGGGISSGSDSDSSIDDQHIPSIHDQPAASHPKRVSILVDETLERGAWLLETYAPLVRSLLSSEFSGSNSALAKRAPAVSMSAGLMVGIEQLRRNIRAARSVPERLDQVIDWATEQEELLVQAGIMAYRQEYAADPVLREISPRVEALELVGLDAETLAAIVDGSGPFTGRGLTGSQEAAEAAPSGTLDATGVTGEPGQAVAAMSMAERMMQVYESSGVPVPDFGRIRSGSMIVDGALQRLALDSEGMRRYVDVLASEVGMGASSGAAADEGKQRLAQRVSEIAASAANLEHAIMRQMEEVPSDVVVVVAERPVAAILASRLGVPRVQEALALPSV